MIGFSGSKVQPTPPRFNIGTVLFVTAGVSGVGAVVVNTLFPNWRLIHYPLHAAIEGIGAFAAFVVALLILRLHARGHLSSAYIWAASALIGMGFLDGLHAVRYAGTGFVWLHSIATFVGGIVFAGVWFADRFSHAWVEQIVPKTVLFAAIVIGVGSLVFPQAVPEMVVDGQFSIWARLTNIFGGLGFLAASAYFALSDSQHGDGQHGDSQNRVVFSAQCFLFGLSGIIFEFSAIWDAAWWLWHVLRICAYMIAVSFYFAMARSIEQELYVLKGNLERSVSERTRSLKEQSDLRQEAQASLRKIGQAVDQSPILVFITDTNGTIEYVNPKFEELTGYSKAEAIGQTPRLLKSPDTPKETHENLWHTILSGKTWSGKLKDSIKGGGYLWASVIISPIRNDRGVITHFVALHEDITVRIKAEGAMKEARAAAEIANKAKTDLIANMSHELRTPLNAIIGFSEIIKDAFLGPIENPQYQDYGEHIYTSGRHLLDLINDILDVSAVEAGKLQLHEETLSLFEVCEAALRIVRPKADEGRVAISGLQENDLPLFKGDVRRLKQVFLNLFSNAIKFTPKGGDVTCRGRVDDRGRVVITVCDTGIGMSEEGIAKALSKFGQVDSSLSRKHEGSGLGLPLTRHLVEVHGGALEVISERDQGTKIVITFPRERVVDLLDEGGST